jgi:DNA-binding transcriptional LysR family regulator
MIDSRLNYVVASARHGSFTAAAEAVGVTQSAITKSIADLERQLGFAIFHRTARGIILTEDGRSFVDRASRLLEDAKNLLQGPSRRDDAFAGTLRIGVCPTSLDWHLAEPITKLIRRHPSIRFDLSGSSFERMAQNLRSGTVDVVVGFDDAFKEFPEFRRERLGTSRTVMFARKDHPILKLASPTAKDVAQYEFVSPSESRPFGTQIRDYYESQGIDAQNRIHTIDFFPIVMRIVANSNALSWTAERYAERPSFSKRFSIVPVRRKSMSLAHLCCSVRARWEIKPAARAFIEACQASIS